LIRQGATTGAATPREEWRFYGDALLWTAAERDRWARETRAVVEFLDSSDETFRVFALR
jgi:hypothetical protein